MNFGKLGKTWKTATDYSGLYNFISKSNGISLDNGNYLDHILTEAVARRCSVKKG